MDIEPGELLKLDIGGVRKVIACGEEGRNLIETIAFSLRFW